MTRNKRPTRQKMIMIERVTNSRAVPHPPLTLQSQAILEGGGGLPLRSWARRGWDAGWSCLYRLGLLDGPQALFRALKTIIAAAQRDNWLEPRGGGGGRWRGDNIRDRRWPLPGASLAPMGDGGRDRWWLQCAGSGSGEQRLRQSGRGGGGGRGRDAARRVDL